jgi:pyrroloquinoline quinone (PQQ) biosynthesis protein C
MSDFYSRLLGETEAARREFLSIPLLQQALEGAISRETYLAFLVEAYHHVKHTTPLLMACGARLPESMEWLREAIGEYIEEEMGHQEWILNDIAALGADKEAVRRGTPSVETELMVSYAWDTIQRRNPAGFFGMVLVLEGTSVALAIRAADAIESSLQLPAAAFSYLRSHGSLDVEHVDFYQRLMNRVADREAEDAIIHCARVMYRLYGDIFRRVSQCA